MTRPARVNIGPAAAGEQRRERRRQRARQQRQRDRRIALHRHLRGVGRELAPALRLFEARSRRAAEMRHVGDDLQRVAVAADLVAVELGLHAGLVDEVLRRAAAEHDRRGPRPADHQVRRLDDVADDVDVAGAGLLLPRLRQPHPDGRIGDRRAEDRHVGAIGAGQDPLEPGGLPEMAAEQVEELARRVVARLERAGEVGDPLVVRAELLLARVGVVDAIDPVVGQRRIVGVRRADVVMLAARLVEIVVEVRAGRDEAVDVAVQDEVRDDQAQPAGATARRPCRGRSSRRPAASSARCDAPWRDCGPETKSAPCARSPASAVSPASTTNGSIGVCRKRDFFFMREQLNHKCRPRHAPGGLY